MISTVGTKRGNRSLDKSLPPSSVKIAIQSRTHAVALSRTRSQPQCSDVLRAVAGVLVGSHLGKPILGTCDGEAMKASCVTAQLQLPTRGPVCTPLQNYS